MGTSISKSPLERRNTVLRRSQKRSIANTDQQIERLFKDIRKFKGIEEDENYTKLVNKIEDFKRELSRKSKDLVPAVRNLHAKALDKISQAEILLENKFKENIEKEIEKKAKKEKEKDTKVDKEDQNQTENDDIEANNNVDEMIIEELERQRDDTASPLSSRALESEQNSLIASTDKRKTVEINLVQVVPEETPITQLERSPKENRKPITQLERSPKEARKSIMKYGVQVLPNINNEMSPRASLNRSQSPSLSQNSRQSVTNSDVKKTHSIKSDEDLLNNVSNDVRNIEEEISLFVGKKDGVEYNRLKEALFTNVDKLSNIQDKSNVTYSQIKRYIDSCLSFLDEKAVVVDEDDEVFLPDNKLKTTIHQFKITSI